MRTIRILFLGQCLHYGYAGVPRHRTFPVLCREMLAARFPGISFRFFIKFFFHPLGLSALLRHRLPLVRPHLTIINCPAMFAATSWRVNLVYEIAPEIVDTARSLIQTIDAGIAKAGRAPVSPGIVDKAFVRRPPIELSDYERCLEDAVRICAARGAQLVLMGPGGFNENTIESYERHSPKLWAEVNSMVLSVGARLGVPVIDVQQMLSERGPDVFIPNNHRWSVGGQEIVAREVESVIARQLNLRPKR